MSELVLDVGNTEFVCASYHNGERESLLRIGVREGWQEWLQSFLRDQLEEGPVQPLAASVNTDLDEPLRQIFRQHDLDLPFLTAENCGLTLDVEVPAEVGADRIANVFGARFLAPNQTVVVVDVGTAVVFDAISQEGDFLGGAIAPGAEMCATALHQTTSLLPKVDVIPSPTAISRSTAGNISSGVYNTLLGGIERILKLMRQELGGDVKTIATGGLLGEVGEAAEEHHHQLGSALRRDLSGLVDIVEPELTLRGIREATVNPTCHLARGQGHSEFG